MLRSLSLWLLLFAGSLPVLQQAAQAQSIVDLPAAQLPAKRPAGQTAVMPTMTVLTLNIAHARGQGPSQLLQSTGAEKRNLLSIAELLQREQPDVVALQESDTNSFWNGGFNHTAYLADQAGFPAHFTGSHFKGFVLDYGTALLSHTPLQAPVSDRFLQPMLRPRKGFVLATVQWPGHPDISVDVVSVHFDFLMKGKRLAEAKQMVELLRTRENPVVVMGDLNTDYRENSEVIPLILAELGLSAWQPEADLVTFPRLKRRFDWVLVSSQIGFASHQVLEDDVSDHRAVVAVLTWLGNDPA